MCFCYILLLIVVLLLFYFFILVYVVVCYILYCITLPYIYGIWTWYIPIYFFTLTHQQHMIGDGHLLHGFSFLTVMDGCHS